MENKRIYESYEDRQVRLEREGFLKFGDAVRGPLGGMQSQYASRYVNGMLGEYPNLSEGLRFDGNPEDYHELAIHKDDVVEFVRRVKEYLDKSR
ncbi:MAG: hypothetical protein WCW14_02675 [Candidatus Paceibacterota bacterium]|jgi:hypothetical protein